MELEAVVLCGEGQQLEPLSTGVAKAMLPVANKPLIEYALDFCQRAMFRRVTVAVVDHDYEEVAAYVSEKYPKVRLIETSHEKSSGDVVVKLSSELTGDFVVIPCDMLTNADPNDFVAAYRSRDDDALVVGFYHALNSESIDIKTLNPDILLHSRPRKEDGRSLLLDSYSRQQIKNKKRLAVRMAMLWKYDSVLASTQLLTAGIYFCSHKVLSLLLQTPQDKWEGKSIHELVRDLARRSWQHSQRLEEVLMAYVPKSASYLRTNKLITYLEANRNEMKLRARSAPRPVAANDKKEKGSAVIGNDSLLGENTNVGERSSVKRTVVGSNCTIGKKCKLTGCVLLDGVTVGDDVGLENCLLGKGAIVQTKTRLVNCSVEGNYEVVAETEAKDEILKGMGLAGDVDEEYDGVLESMSDFEEEVERSSESESDSQSLDYDGDEVAVSDYDEDELFDRS